jgi:hypothetical protein
VKLDFAACFTYVKYVQIIMMILNNVDFNKKGLKMCLFIKVTCVQKNVGSAGLVLSSVSVNV